ncbi:UNVERIFIED_CONTAM: hypothetical protein H355_013539, partial [Colinus virginianus]
MVIPQAPEAEGYAREVHAVLRRGGVMADLDADASATLGRKIRRAQLTHYNFQLGKGERDAPRLRVNPSPPCHVSPPPPCGMGVAALSQWFPAACPPPHPHPDGNWDLWVQQEEQDFTDILAAAGADDILHPRAPSTTSTWGSILEGFPPAWPLPDSLSRYCSSPALMPRAPRPSLPPAAFAHLRRQVAALDSFWPRLDRCCLHHAPLPCARRA